MTYIHNISPIMLEVFGIKLYWYGFMYAISFVIIDYLIVSASKNKNIDLEPPAAEKLTIVVLLFAIIGGRLGYVIFYDLSYLPQIFKRYFIYGREECPFMEVLLELLSDQFIFQENTEPIF